MNSGLKKKLVGSAVSLVVVLIALLLVVLMWHSQFSFGWFAMNKNVDSTGMTVNVETIPNLVMRGTEDDEWVYNITYDEDIIRMLPATMGGVGASGLKYVTNPEVLSFHSGLAKSGKTLTYDEVEHDTLDDDEDGVLDHVYYREYTFDLAMDIKSVEGSLTATLPDLGIIESDDTVEEFSDDNPIPDSHKAATVWVFVNDESKGQLTVANADTPLTIYEGDIPSVDETPLSVKLRIYFDGELKKDADTAYINTETVDLRGLLLNVRISLNDNEE